MKKKRTVFHTSIDEALSKQIYLNINHLEKGRYTLKIIHKRKVIGKITFKK